jgi:glycosyltransferase involved in cell wall biosynthesis
MWQGKSVSVILMTYAERGSIRATIEGFFATGLVDEVLVVNNNAEPGTSEEVAKTPAREVIEPRQGYGWASRRGLAEATGDLLAYSDECEAVFGTRTTRSLIWSGANMGLLLKWGNWAVAKLVEALFNTSHLSDVGCTYKLLHRSLARRLLPELRVGGSHFGPELMLAVITSGARFVEVPVNYLPRVGTSAVTGDLRKAIVLGLQMIGFILLYRLKTLGKTRRPPALVGQDEGDAGPPSELTSREGAG